MLRPRCGRQGRRPSRWGLWGIWQGPIRFSWLVEVMAGWRCPEGDASSRWLIDIRTDLFPPTTMIAARTRMPSQGRQRSAGGTGAADRPDRSVRHRRKARRRIRCSRAPMCARNTTWGRGRDERARRSAAVDAARPARSPPPQQEYDEEPEPEYQPSPVHPLHRYAAQQPRSADEQDYHEPAQYADEAARRSLAV